MVVFGGSKHLGPLDRDGGVPLNKSGHHSSLGLDPQRQRGDVQQEHILHLTNEHPSLDGGPDGHHFVRVHVLGRLAARDLGDQVDHRGHAGRAADQDHVVDLAFRDPSIGDGLLKGGAAALEKIRGEFLELGSGQRVIEVEWALVGGRDKGQIHLGLLDL